MQCSNEHAHHALRQCADIKVLWGAGGSQDSGRKEETVTELHVAFTDVVIRQDEMIFVATSLCMSDSIATIRSKLQQLTQFSA